MIAVVPARGGSKGIPRKNLRMVAGKPLIIHTLECALNTSCITRTVVSTDDEEIAALARSIPGVEAPFLRPRELANDNASAVDVYLHAANELSRDRQPVDELCCLLPTAPLRQPGDIESCVTLFKTMQADVVLSVIAAKPISWHQAVQPNGRLTSLPNSNTSIDNRQGYERSVIPNGAIYVLRMEALARTRTYFGPRSWGYEMPASRSIDIDTEDDLTMAEALMTKRSLS